MKAQLRGKRGAW